jgi:hypothetical protein
MSIWSVFSSFYHCINYKKSSTPRPVYLEINCWDINLACFCVSSNLEYSKSLIGSVAALNRV